MALLVFMSTSLPAYAVDVTGKVTATGLTTNGDIVVSLEAPGLTVSPPANPVSLDQKDMRFIPHVLPVVKGTTVRSLNSDSFNHNIFSPEGRYNLGTWPKGETRDHTFDKAGVYTQLCRVHSEMEAFVVVLNTPYFAVTNRDGTYTIKNVPPGKYTLVAWSEKLKTSKQNVSVAAENVTVPMVTLTK